MRRLPAEWEPQSAVMLTWPHDGTDWAPRLAAVEGVYLQLAMLIARRQRLLVVCRDAEHRDQIRQALRRAEVPAQAVHLAVAPSNDSWARDHGPITVVDSDGRARVIDFRFNGWGGKFAARLDDAITGRLTAQGDLGISGQEWSTLVLEGGAIESDGAGSLLAVKRTLEDPARNPGLSLGQIEAELEARLGIRHFLWLQHGQLSGDDTDGHIDTLARFCSQGSICHAVPHPDAPASEAESLGAMIAELRALRDPSGHPYRLVPLPAPAPVHDRQGEILPAGYANFLLINDAVLLPTYGDPADDAAAAVLAAEFPDRQVEAVDCRELIRQGGSLHCITMQLPAALMLPETQ